MNRPKRGCGSCYACCKTHGVHELEKMPSTLCEYCKPGRKACRIYKKRPRSCAEFQCFWLIGAGSESDRPDRLGVVIDILKNQSLNNLQIAQFFEYIPGKLSDERVLKHARDALKTQIFVCFMKLDGTITVFFSDSHKEKNIGLLPEGTIVGTREELGL